MIPDWYNALQAAELLRCAPWELPEQPIYWVEAALAKARAEQRALRDIARRQRARQGAARR